jgi:tetratricopeptide (TPR) repeat protein
MAPSDPSNNSEDPQPPLEELTPFVREADSEDEPAAKPRRRWPRFILIYLVILLAGSAVAYVQGQSLNEERRSEQVSLFLQEQFDLGIQDIEDEKYELARQRFEAILRFDPTFPQAEEKLIEVFLALRKPSITPTPRPTPTPDPSPPDLLFSQAEAALNEGDWTTTINKLLTLRSRDPTYRAIEADGMMYIALRNRGMTLIAQGLMEEGLYDLSLAQRFGPLDRDAFFRRTLAEQYLLANSYIGLNWARAAELFSALCEQGATVDSCFKFAESAWNYGDLLWNAEDPCAAQVQYEGSYNAWENGTLVPTATKAAEACATATAPPTAPPEPTETPTPRRRRRTPTPTPTPTS